LAARKGAKNATHPPIASSTARAELEEVDALLAVALEEVRRKLVVEAHKDQRRETGRR
jgi:hypothetical protein